MNVERGRSCREVKRPKVKVRYSPAASTFDAFSFLSREDVQCSDLLQGRRVVIPLQ